MDENRRGDPGEIRGLVELVDEHPDELTYDFRERFGLSLAAAVDGTLTFDEAWALCVGLMKDPTSRTFAARAEWKYPMSREALILSDLIDITVGMNTRKGKKPKSYQRPWDKKHKGVKSKKPTVDQATIRAALAQRGH